MIGTVDYGKGGLGDLPDVLATEKIQFALSNPHSPVFTFHVVHIFPYRGLCTCIHKKIAHLRLGAIA